MPLYTRMVLQGFGCSKQFSPLYLKRDTVEAGESDADGQGCGAASP